MGFLPATVISIIGFWLFNVCNKNQASIADLSKSVYLLDERKIAGLFQKISSNKRLIIIGFILQLIMVFQGFHLLSGAFSPQDFLSDYGRIFARRRGVILIPFIFALPYLIIAVFGLIAFLSFLMFFAKSNNEYSLKEKLNKFRNAPKEKKQEYQDETRQLLSEERVTRFQQWKSEIMKERKPTNNLLLTSQRILGVPLVQGEDNVLMSLIKAALIYGDIDLENWERISTYKQIDDHYFIKSNDGNILARIKSNDPIFNYQLGILKILDEGKSPQSTSDEGLLYRLAYAWSISLGKEVPDASSKGCLLPIIGIILIVLAIALYQNILFIPGIFFLVIGLPPYFRKVNKKSEIITEWIAAGRPAPGKDSVEKERSEAAELLKTLEEAERGNASSREEK